jgi:hypothetical protein
MRRAFLLLYASGWVAVLWMLAHAHDLQGGGWDGDSLAWFAGFAALPLIGGVTLLVRPIWRALGRAAVVALPVIAAPLALVIVVIGVPRYLLDGRSSQFVHATGDVLLSLSVHGGMLLLVVPPLVWLLRRLTGGRQAPRTI